MEKMEKKLIKTQGGHPDCRQVKYVAFRTVQHQHG